MNTGTIIFRGRSREVGRPNRESKRSALVPGGAGKTVGWAFGLVLGCALLAGAGEPEIPPSPFQADVPICGVLGATVRVEGLRWEPYSFRGYARGLIARRPDTQFIWLGSEPLRLAASLGVRRPLDGRGTPCDSDVCPTALFAIGEGLGGISSQPQGISWSRQRERLAESTSWRTKAVEEHRRWVTDRRASLPRVDGELNLRTMIGMIRTSSSDQRDVIIGGVEGTSDGLRVNIMIGGSDVGASVLFDRELRPWGLECQAGRRAILPLEIHYPDGSGHPPSRWSTMGFQDLSGPSGPVRGWGFVERSSQASARPALRKDPRERKAVFTGDGRAWVGPSSVGVVATADGLVGLEVNERGVLVARVSTLTFPFGPESGSAVERWMESAAPEGIQERELLTLDRIESWPQELQGMTDSVGHLVVSCAGEGIMAFTRELGGLGACRIELTPDLNVRTAVFVRRRSVRPSPDQDPSFR